ncbi:site-2 protease family protein [Spirulina subsalsa]|uniref:site-2 protease family protein n=1 Tax=Spirulina subsalsa TaxID=54311 RepID=UPI0002FC4423|nr:site-2 protease family protein [Spirulina subsalsa]
MTIVEFILLICLGLLSYLIVKRTVSHLTTTPIWLLWLVLMLPPLLLSVWLFLFGEDQPLPWALLILPFILCPLLYWWLIQKGRLPLSATEEGEDGLTPKTKGMAATSDNKLMAKPLTPEEEKRLRNCFPWGVYYLQNVDYRPQAILCRGRLKSNPEVAYHTVRANVEQKFGDRFLLIFQEGTPNKPFFALVPNPWSQQKTATQTEPLKRPVLALALLFITLFTTTLIGVELAGFTVDQLQTDPRLFVQGLPYSLPLVAILGVHELSHYGAAVYYKIRATLPYFIPMPFFLGTFGAFIQMRSPVPHRKALFDVAIAGPLGGFILSLPILIWGLMLSETTPLLEDSSLLSFQALDPRFSLFLSVLGKLTLGSDLTTNMAIALHPLAIAGYLGIIVTALNLMPVGQLDGGHIVHSMFGQRSAIAIGQIVRFLMFLFALQRPELMVWAVILLLLPTADEPALNDVTELDNSRDLLGLLALGLLVIILFPVPGILAQWLNL